MSGVIRIAGIDPGSRYTGIGIIDKTGSQLKHVFSETIVTVKEKTLEAKLLIIFERLTEIFDIYRPQSTSIEKIFHSVNPHSSLILGHARGVAMLSAKKYGMDVHEYAPTAIKSAVVGAGRAPKDQVAAMVQILLNLDRSKKRGEDESDALAIAICHANSLHFRSKISF